MQIFQKKLKPHNGNFQEDDGNSNDYKYIFEKFENSRQKGVNHWIIKHILFRYNKIFIILFLIFTILSSFLGSYLYIVFGEAIDVFSNAGAGSDQVIAYTVKILIIGIGNPLIAILARFSREILAQKMEKEIRGEFYLSILSKSQSFHDYQKLGDLMARATNDVRLLNFLISPGISALIESFISLIVPVVMIIIYYPFQLILVPIIFSIFFILSLKRYVNKLIPLMRGRRIEYGNMNSILNESLEGIEIVKSTAQESENVEKYKNSAEGYKEYGIRGGYIRALYYPLLYIAIAITLGLIHGVILFKMEMISIGSIIGYLALLSRLRFPTNASNWAFFILQRAKAGAERLIEIMNKKSKIPEKKNPIKKEIKGKVEFKNVSFNYPGNTNKVLKNVNFSINPGEVIAIVGTTGSGKTTLTKLISRLYDIQEGQILIDGIDICDYSLQSLRSQIAYIEQDIFLFSKSVMKNIEFAKSNISKEEIYNVGKEAQAHDFIKKLPNGYQTKIGERGIILSGGERQRIAIARAFLSEPKILILDDASSAIDAKTEEKIQQAISNILKGQTTFLITHRLSQIRWADLIIVLKQGKIIAKGTHYELLKKSKEYRKIFLKKYDKKLNQILEGEN